MNRNSIMKAPYVGFINFDSPTFGDIAVLAKGKLKKNADQTYYFEQINERCDEKCQINADKYLENVAALWMVERIRHRDATGHHTYDLKFTIVPIYSDQKHQIDHNILENRLKNHTKRTFILRETDYPTFFQTNANRRTDLFSPGFERSLSSIMSFSPNSLMQNLLGLNLSPQSPSVQKQKSQPKDNRYNVGEYMAPKILNSPPKVNYHPMLNGHAYTPVDHHVRFPDSREMTINKPPPMNFYRPKPEIYNQKNIVDYRGANDNVFVGSSEHKQMHPNQQIAVPVYSIPVDMPMIQLAQSPGYFPGAFPFQIQLSTPANQLLYPQQHQPDTTTFRYQPQLIGLSNRHQQPLFFPFNLIQANKSKPFQESERHTMNYYSVPDPVYHIHQQSTTEAPIQPSTYSPRFNNYASILRPQIEMPVISTASSIQVNRYDDNEFHPMTPSYDLRKYYHVRSSTTPKPDSINAQLLDTHGNSDTVVPYVTLPPAEDTSVKTNEVSYNVVADRPKLNEKASEKPVLKWIPKKQRINKLTNVTSTTSSPNPFVPTIIPIETSTESSTKSTTHHFRGRNRYNRRNSTSVGVRASAISPTKIGRKKTTSAVFTASTPSPLTTASIFTVFPTYITQQTTDEPITLQSLSTSISLEVNGERISDLPTTTNNPTTTVGYELIPVGVESIATNTSNLKLFKASINNLPEKFDDFTFSILNHAKALDSEKDKN